MHSQVSARMRGDSNTLKTRKLMCVREDASVTVETHGLRNARRTRLPTFLAAANYSLAERLQALR